MKTKFLRVSYKNDTVKIPYLEIKGKKKGPHVFISGGMHGNEINGIAVVDKFIEWAANKKICDKLSGQITVIPLVNPSGFYHMRREVQIDKKDPNRCFGVTEPKTFTERMVGALSFTGIFSSGLLGRIYYSVQVDDMANSAACLPSGFCWESYPQEKMSFSGSFHLRQHYPSFIRDGAVQLMYTRYWDTWAWPSYSSIYPQ